MDTLEYENTITGGEEQASGISADLIRGHINTIILRSLYDGDKYGYDIINEIEKKSGGLYVLKQPTLYSALKRLESLKYVESYYGEFSNGGRRKYFSLTDEGKRVTEKNLSEWEYSRTIIDSLISDGDAHYDFSFITDKQKELTDLKESLAARETALEDERKALNSLKNELQRERALLQTQSSTLSTQKSDVKEWKEKMETQAAELTEKENALAEKQGVIDAKELELAEKEREIEIAKRELDARNEEIQRLQSQLDLQKEQIHSLSQELANKENSMQSFGDLNAEKMELATEKAAFESEKAAMEEERDALRAQMQTLEVERDTLRADNAALEETKAELQKKKQQLDALSDSLQAQRTEIDKKTYEITQLEYRLEEQKQVVRDKQTQTNADTEEIERKLADIQNRENELMHGNQKLQDDLLVFQNQQKEFANRQSLYNQQQLDLITRKNALAAQQFEYADKLSSYNAQVKAFNENLEKFETDRAALRSEQLLYDDQRRAFENEKAEFAQQKSAFEKEKAEIEQFRADTQKSDTDNKQELQRRYGELQEKELELNNRENALNSAYRDFQARQYAASTYANTPRYDYGYTPQPQSPYSAPQPQQTEQTYGMDYADLQQRAQAEGIKLQTAGSMRYHSPIQRERNETAINAVTRGTYNMGLTLFKSAFIVFCIIVFESLLVFFLKDYLGVSYAYPAIGFAVGFAAFIVCAILYATGYKPRVRRKKHATYIATTAILFVIGVIIVTMIAVFLKAELSLLPQMLSFVVIPVAYLANILIFTAFYRVFSIKESSLNR